jgi:hypothetical protein
MVALRDRGGQTGWLCHAVASPHHPRCCWSTWQNTQRNRMSSKQSNAHSISHIPLSHHAKAVSVEAVMLSALRLCESTALAVHLVSSSHRGLRCTAGACQSAHCIQLMLITHKNSQLRVCSGGCQRNKVACICPTTLEDQHQTRAPQHTTPSETCLAGHHTGMPCTPNVG